MDCDLISAIIFIITLIVVTVGMFVFEIFQNNYDYVKKELVQAVVIDKGTHTRRSGKSHQTVYDTTFKYEDIETKIEGSSLYNNLEINDEITMNKCIYYKNGEVIRTELELIK